MENQEEKTILQKLHDYYGVSCKPELVDHPDGKRVKKLSQMAALYTDCSPFKNRVCWNCEWFDEQDVSSLSDVEEKSHPLADGKGPAHRCLLVDGGIDSGGYCINWGTLRLTVDKSQEDAFDEMFYENL